MKKVIAMVMVLALVLMVGCAKEATPAKPAVKAPTEPATTPDTSSGTEAEVANLEADLADLEGLEMDIDSDLDSLDEDLNFEI